MRSSLVLILFLVPSLLAVSSFIFLDALASQILSLESNNHTFRTPFLGRA